MESEVKRTLRLRTKGCTTEAQVKQVVEAMPQNEKMKYVYDLATEETFEDIKAWSLWFINFCDDHDIVNDHVNGVGKQEPTVGVLLAASKMIQMQAEGMARQEMQCLSEETKYGMEVADAISDYATAIHTATDHLSNLVSHYSAILRGRRMQYHFTDEQGTGVPIDDSDVEQLRLDLEGK
jgi:hypothetical protein